MLNRTVLVGRLTRDPELKYSQSGVAICNFTLAVNRTFTNQQGEREADFINIVSFKKTAENAANYLSKGSLCGIDGKIQTRNYEGSDGKRVYITEVVADSVQFLDTKKSGQNESKSGQSYQSSNQSNTQRQDDPFGG